MTFFKIPLVILLACLILLSGCSSKYNTKSTEVFKYQILDDDAKMFTYSLIFVNQSTSGKSDKNKKKEKQTNKKYKRGMGKKVTIEDQMTEELEEGLAQKLVTNGYCRKGYFELARDLKRTIYSIRGECNESATPEDRINFVNK